jgi:hypothetical protein
MQVVNRNRAIFNTRYLSLDQLDDYIAIVEIDGKDVFLDPGQKLCPFGSLHWKHALASGLRLSEKGFSTAVSPAITYKTAVVQRIAELNVDAQSNLKGTLRLILSGPDALHWRQLAIDNDPEQVKKDFNESVRALIPDGVDSKFDHFIALDEQESSLIAVLQVTGNLGAPTGKRFFLPGSFFESRAHQPFVSEEKRITPVDVHHALTEEDDVTYHLPAGFSIESAPQPLNEAWTGHAFLKTSASRDGDAINVTRTLAYNFALLEPKDYDALRAFYQKVAAADQQQLVLTRVEPAKGN